MNDKKLRITVILALILIADLVLVRYFNVLVWPYLWPRPAVFYLLGGLALLMLFPEILTSLWMLRLFGGFMVFVGQCYVFHSFDVLWQDFSIISLIHFVGVSGVFVTLLLSYLNQITPRNNTLPASLPQHLPFVAAVVPTYGEPLDILETTIDYLKRLDYPADKLLILISDDGHRPGVAALAYRYGVHYSQGARKEAKAGNLNSALAYLEEHCPKATLILTQDADEIIHYSFLTKIVGYFTDPKVAFVQTPKDAFAPKGDPFGVRDRVFYDRVQPGRNGADAAFSCGSGVVWRIEALKSIGGFVTWNIVEDLTTSYYLHSAGWRSEYHNEILTVGLAPDDIPGLLKQRGTWATDTWRLFLFRNPFRRPGLTLRQRLQYTELGMFYVTSAFFTPLLMLTPLLSLLTGKFTAIEGSALFPLVIFTVCYYVALTQSYGEFLKRMWQYWIAHFFTYQKAFWIAVRSRDNKPSYKVTRKTRQGGFYGIMLWPHLLYLTVGSLAVLNGLVGMPDVSVSTRLTNIGILLFFMYMVGSICLASFYGLKLPVPSFVARIKRRLQEPSISAPQTGSAD